MLTDSQIKAAKPAEKPYKLTDERGLYLEVAPAGGKWWRFKYRIDGKEKRISLGVYPDISLRDARDRRDDARKLVANGVDPSMVRQAQKASRLERANNSFEVIAREWYEKQSGAWVPSHGERIIRRLERDVFPKIGGLAIADITAPILLGAIRKIEERGAVETAHRALQNCGQVMRYAIATGRAERDPTPDLRGALKPVQSTHFASVTDPVEVGRLMALLDTYNGSYTVRAALKLAPLFFVRPGELRNAKWADFDLELGEWRYTVPKTKTQHIVPLCDQAIDILLDLKQRTDHSEYVFPGGRSPLKAMSDNALNAGLRSLDIPADKMSGHGFRAMARTMLDEVLGYPPHIIEQQLAHAVRDPLGRAYNRTAHLSERKKMMQAWADYLERIKSI
ncbi:tyrosine-type recombinase/integrase [Fluviibacter phosphoraccumulans]|uniref:tyrosine-type recombinase/integrase n=1 Tax=Fluviibacter phosphoraccumulans TaxID=1751046 RepID=UPI0024E230A6|nr:integrase arm-type DNA-binding domain-containing protein [Fluviibacter phosphoraccumulans]